MFLMGAAILYHEVAIAVVAEPILIGAAFVLMGLPIVRWGEDRWQNGNGKNKPS